MMSSAARRSPRKRRSRADAIVETRPRTGSIKTLETSCSHRKLESLYSRAATSAKPNKDPRTTAAVDVKPTSTADEAASARDGGHNTHHLRCNSMTVVWVARWNDMETSPESQRALSRRVLQPKGLNRAADLVGSIGAESVSTPDALTG
jgi:hypothetical protein